MIFKAVETIKGISQIKEFSEKYNICYKTAQILMQRGIDTDEKFHKFTSPSLDDLRDPFLLDGMTDCHNRIQKAIDNNESILIFGDYDVDGISATAILYKYLKDKVSSLNYFLPNRYEDGYGLTIESSKKIIDKFDPKLIITVDCGISCVNEVDYIKSQGIDIIITDHHEVAEALPNTIVVDPKIPNQNYGFEGLCGAGVAMKVVETFVGRQNLDEYLPICAIATISDIVPLIDENRAIVKLGIAKQNLLPEGLKMLIKETKITEINSQAVSFKLAPKLNATGRMGNAYYSLNLYISNDKNTLNNSLKMVVELNTKRQQLSQQIYDECIEIIKREKLYLQKAIVLKNDHWDSGLLGIACARLVDEYYRPVFLFSDVNGELKGSVRSIGSINIHSVLSVCNNYLETFGGHSMAAGLSLKAEHFDNFKNQIFDYLNQNTTDDYYLPIKYYDVALKQDEITLQLVNELNLLEPFGCENPNPLFMITYSNCSASKLQITSEHLSINSGAGFRLIAFNALDEIDDYLYTETKQTICELQVNEFRDKKYLKCIVKKTLFDGYEKNLQNIADGRLLKQYLGKKQYQNQINFFEQNQTKELLDKLMQTKNGTAIIIYNKLTYQKYKDLLATYKLNCYVGGSQSKFAENCIVLALDDVENVNDYNNLVFLESLQDTNFLNTYSGNVYAIKNTFIKINNVDMSRNCFGYVYKAMREIMQKNLHYSNELEFYNLVKKHCVQIKLSYQQFVVCLYTFLEIGTIKLDTKFGWTLYIDESKKTKLENSNFYNRIYFITKIAQ